MHRTVRLALWLNIVMAAALVTQAVAQEKPAAPQPTTTARPDVSTSELKLLLKPLTKDELVVEVTGWLALVRTNAMDIARLQIAATETKKEIAEAKKEAAEAATQPAASADPATTSAVEQKAEIKQNLDAQLPKLVEEQTALLDRARLVLTEFAAKGGDRTAHDKYLDAVAGVQIDPTDANAAWNLALGWLKSPQGGLRWARNIVLALLTLLAFRILGGIAGAAVHRALMATKGVSHLLRDFMVNSLRKLIAVIGVVMALSMLEVNIGPFVAAIGAVGFVVGFALQGTLSNFAAGVMILLYRPYDLGDKVTAGGITGKVESMSLVSTTIRTEEGNSVVLPNSSIWGSAIHQFAAK